MSSASANGAGWNEERIALLKKLWKDGKSGSQIARYLGGFQHCADGGRMAVIGKVHRLGLSGRGTTSRMKSHRPRKPRTPRYVGALSPVRAILCDGLPIPSPSETDVARVAFIDLEAKHCRFIALSEPAGPHEKQFCGLDAVPGLSWCRAHAMRCLVPVVPRPRGSSLQRPATAPLDRTKALQPA